MHTCPDCRRCSVRLTDGNWQPSRRRAGNRICASCQAAANRPSRRARWRRKKSMMLAEHREWSRSTRLKAIAALGNKCMLCGAGEQLHLAHLSYATKRTRSDSGRATAREALKDLSRFLLLCKDCHFHPEKYLKELIERRLRDA